MRSIHRLVTNIVLVLLLTSCGGNGSDSTGPVGNLPSADDLPSAGTINNPDANKGGADSVGSSTSGPVFGAGVQSNAMLRKSVNWTVEKSDPRIRIRQMPVFTSSVVNPTQAFLAAVLQYVSDQGVCGIDFTDSKALDAAGEELVDEVSPVFSVSPLTGSSSDIDNSTDYRSDCLMPGESGYILGTTSLNASDIESIEIPEFLQGLPFMFTREGIGCGNGIVPISYTLGENDAIEVLVQNGFGNYPGCAAADSAPLYRAAFGSMPGRPRSAVSIRSLQGGRPALVAHLALVRQ